MIYNQSSFCCCFKIKYCYFDIHNQRRTNPSVTSAWIRWIWVQRDIDVMKADSDHWRREFQLFRGVTPRRDQLAAIAAV